MRARTTMDSRRKVGASVTPARSLIPTPTFSLLKPIDGLPTSAAETRHHEWNGQPIGHGFSQISVHSAAKDPQACPLALATPRACPFGGACHSCPARVQSKLAIGQPDNEYEQEADRMAEQVMRMPDAAAPNSPDVVIRRKCAPCNNDQELLRRDAVRPSAFSLQPAGVPPIVNEVLRSPGQPLDPETRAFFGSRFGHDFSQVRVHDDAKAAESARAVNAVAYTVGKDIVIETGRYTPVSIEGKRLLGHELVHTIQQKFGADMHRPISKRLYMNDSEDSFEKEAKALSNELLDDRDEISTYPESGASGVLQRQEPVTTTAATVTISGVVAKCIIGAITGALFDAAIQAALHAWRYRTWRFWRVSLNYCSIILSAILGCIAAPISAFVLEGWISAQLGTRLGGMAGTLIGKILVFIAKKLAIAVPKGLIGKLAKLGCVSPEQAAELGVTPGEKADVATAQ